MFNSRAYFFWMMGFAGILAILLLLPICWETIVYEYPELVIMILPWLCFLCIFSLPFFVIAAYYGFLNIG